MGMSEDLKKAEAAKTAAKNAAWSYANHADSVLGTTRADRDARNMYDSLTGPSYLAQLRGQRTAETQGLIDTAIGQSQGLSSRQNMALANQGAAAIAGQQRGALSALRGSQAASGVRGGLAASQNAAQQAQGVSALGDFRRGLVTENFKAQQEGLKTAGQFVNTQENVERATAADRLGTVMGLRAQKTALEAAKLQASAGGGGGKK